MANITPEDPEDRATASKIANDCATFAKQNDCERRILAALTVAREDGDAVAAAWEQAAKLCDGIAKKLRRGTFNDARAAGRAAEECASAIRAAAQSRLPAPPDPMLCLDCQNGAHSTHDDYGCRKRNEMNSECECSYSKVVVGD